MGYKRGNINRQILEEMYNSGFNFSTYDNWKKNGEYSHEWGSDNEIDMIWMVYRNIAEDKPNPAYMATQLGFGNSYTEDGIIKYRKWSGEASLGGLTGTDRYLTVSGGKKIDFGSFGLVSGVCIMNSYNGLDAAKNVIIHEFGHHLFGGNEVHLQPGVWGIMGGYGSRSQMVNSYERHRLGWKNVLQYDFNPLLPIILGDYLTTGDVLRIKIPNTTKYYLLENHQRISTFDNIDRTSDGKGIYVLYQSENNDGKIYFYNAEGRWDWTFDNYGTHPNGQTVPVFRRWNSTSTGHFDTEKIPYYDTNTGKNISASIEAYVDFYTGEDVYAPLFKGDNKDAMKPNYVEVYSPWSNPSIQNVSFQVIKEDNKLKIIQKFESGTITDLPPSKPQNLKASGAYNQEVTLTWNANTEPDMINGGKYKIYRAEVNGTGEPTNWNLIATINAYNGSTPVTSYTDYESLIYNGTKWLHYKITALDNTQKESIASEKVKINGRIPKIAEDSEFDINNNLTYSLNQNHPNPFNPTTQISYQIPENEFVTLKVYNSLGQEVRTLVNDYQSRGYHNIKFDGSELSSGIYFYKIQAGEFVSVKKMLLAK